MPMDDDFAVTFVAGNIGRDSRLKKKFIQKSQLGEGNIHFCEELLYVFAPFILNVSSVS